MHAFVRTICFSLVLAAVLPFLAFAAEPSQRGSYLHYNNSRRIRFYSWAVVEYTVSNPTPTATDIKIRMAPQGQRNVTIYETSFTVGPNLRFSFHTPVTIGTVNTYNIDMFVENRRVSNKNARESILRLAQSDEQYVCFINDDRELSYGNFSNNENLDGHYVNTSNSTKNAPTHFAGFDNASLLALLRPDFKRMTSRQYTAILDYVARGGTLIFADPRGTMAAWQTPLRQCMPVIPLRIGVVERFDALTQIGGQPEFWPEGIDFLESIPAGDGITTIQHQDFPVLRWGRFGLGHVGVCAINPSLREFQKDGGHNFDSFWRHLLSFGGRITYVSSTRDPSLTKAVDKLTGIQIPKASFIRNLVLIYMALILSCVLLGFFFRQHVRSWIALAVIAVISTQAVFLYARYRQRHLASKTATILEFTTTGAEAKSTEQLVSLTTKSEQTLDLTNANPDLLFRSFPPARRVTNEKTRNRPAAAANQKSGTENKERKMFAEERKGQTEELRDPLKITYRDGRSNLLNLRLTAGKPQFFASLHAAEGQVLKQFPAIRWTIAGPEIAAWSFPETIRAEHAVLICETGYIPLRLRGNEISLESGSDGNLARTGPEYTALSEFLARLNAPAPMVVLFGPIDGDSTNFLDSGDAAEGDNAFSVVGRSIFMVPIIEDRTATEVKLPFERIRIKALRAPANLLTDNGRWTKVITGNSKSPRPYPLDCFLPPGFAKLKPRRIMVDFVPENRGGNIEFRLFVKGINQPGTGIPLPQVSNNTYVIELTEQQQSKLLQPSNGRFLLLLTAQPKRIFKDHLTRMRQNTWTVSRLRIAVEGELPSGRQGRL